MRASRLFLAMTLIVLPGVEAAAQAPASPAPLAEATFDVDGDGAVDRIRIEPPGVVHVALARGRALRERFEAPPGALAAAQVGTDAGPALGGRRVLVVTATFTVAAGEPAPAAPLPVPGGPGRERAEALVLAWQDGALARLWQGPVGRRGDGEHSVHVALTPLGLLRYQARPEVQRCDGQPMYLHPQAWDFRSASFRPVYNAPRLPENAPVLAATSEPPPGASATMASSFRTRAASTQTGAGDAGDLVPPRELDDSNPGTVWREGLGGNGRGEIITLSTSLPRAEVAAVRIVPGDAASPERFRRGNRLRRVGLLVGAERAFWIDFASDPAAGKLPPGTSYWAILPGPIAAQCVTLVLDSVYPGTAAGSARAGDTAIADLAVLTTLDLTPGGAEAALVERVRAGGEA
ncbi:MAG TPA: hypothetical protein VNM90_25090, partial [Haliangium sp.]|nr:hypothetical protein [Haliangium sp.]